MDSIQNLLIPDRVQLARVFYNARVTDTGSPFVRFYTSALS